MRRLSAEGCEVYANWTHSTPVREAETRRAADRIGIPQENLSFMSAADGDLCDHLTELLPRFRELMHTIQPDRVACGAFEQGHIDHDSTNFLVNHAFEGPVLEIPFYHTYTRRIQTLNEFSDRRSGETLRLTADESRLKLECAKMFPSQNIWSVLFWNEAKFRVKGRRSTLLAAEKMRVQEHKDWLHPNHSPSETLLVERCDKWHRWLKAVQLFEDVNAKVPVH